MHVLPSSPFLCLVRCSLIAVLSLFAPPSLHATARATARRPYRSRKEKKTAPVRLLRCCCCCRGLCLAHISRMLVVCVCACACVSVSSSFSSFPSVRFTNGAATAITAATAAPSSFDCFRFPCSHFFLYIDRLLAGSPEHEKGTSEPAQHGYVRICPPLPHHACTIKRKAVFCVQVLCISLSLSLCVCGRGGACRMLE